MQRMSAFSYYLRTGRRLTVGHRLELKFNPWHDPDDGRFTFSGQGRFFGTRASQGQGDAGTANRIRLSSNGVGSLPLSSQGVTRGQFGDGAGLFRIAQVGRNPRIRMRGNGGPPLHDPRTLEQAFPGLGNSPGGAIIAVADNLLDLTGPSRELTTELSKAYADRLVRELQALDPSFRFDKLDPGGFPSTAEGQANLINDLRLARAKTYYKRGEILPFQVEVTRFLQRHTKEAYARGLEELKAGRLPVRLSTQEALGNYVDREVARELTKILNRLDIPSGRGQLVQVNRRAYHSPESTYSRPDARVGNISFDWSLTAKNLTTRQIQNFFRSDFQPEVVVIIRPSQLGSPSSYAITKPPGR